MNNLLRIRTLTDRFFDGDTTPEEEQELYDFYRQDSIPEDLRPNQELFRDLAALATLAPSERVGAGPVPARNSGSVPARKSAPARGLSHRRRLWLPAAAVAVVLTVGGVMVWRAGPGSAPTWQDRHQPDDECVAYIYGQRVTDREVVFGEMQKTMTAMTADGGDAVEEQLKAMFSN